PYTHELFEDAGPVPGLGRAGWLSYVTGVLATATLAVPADDGWRPTGGRDGLHTEALGYLLAEMQHLHRAHPGATW
ncbi:MAG: ring,2-phenylacetyl-CoA epoxidase subunit PaaC, partial [Cryptosporangiaceae bacterium]|nr:ring,2-phenylacetyl-CoA epoxidase subunit PaaC [Cryptosporangiaceae bacterium]